MKRDLAGLAHVVALSGGKDSTAMALRLSETESGPFTFVCTPTGDELPEMVAHWRRLESLLSAPLLMLEYPGGLKALCKSEGALPNHRMRFCTRILKLAPFRRFMQEASPCTAYVGLRADEDDREGHGGDLAPGGVARQRFPLREWGWGEEEVWSYLNSRGIVIPERTDCARCFYQRIGEWWNLWRQHPEIWADAEREEVDCGHTYRSPGRDTWPVALKDLRAVFETGRKPDVSLRMMETRKGMCRACTL